MKDIKEIEKIVDKIKVSPQKKRSKRTMSRKMMIATAIVVGCFVITASAALLSYYGKVETTATVSQSVLLDGNDYTVPQTHTFDTAGGCYECFEHTLENQGCSEAPINIVTTGLVGGITTEYYKFVEYSYECTFPQGLHVLVKEDGDWLVWNYTFAESPTHTPKMTVAIDYPNGYCITTFDDGSHDGWYYAPDGGSEVRFADYSGGTHSDWAETSVVDNVMTVKIKKDHLGDSFEWHGFGNYNGNGVWVNPTETGNWDASLYQVNFWSILSSPFTLPSGESWDIKICYNLSLIHI